MVKHVWQDGHTIDLRLYVDGASYNEELEVKEAVHIMLSKPERRMNKDISKEISWIWLQSFRSCPYQMQIATSAMPCPPL